MAVKSIQHNQHTFDISYEIVNPEAKVDLIILHGWGSNKNLMKQTFSPYMSAFRHIYIDLPGFGNSTCSAALTTADVARIVELLMIHMNASKDIILGHSFGGKVALLLEPKVLVLVASAGIYTPKSLKVQAKIAVFKALKGLGLSKFRSLFVANDAKELSEYMYQTFKNVVNEDFSDEFAKFDEKALLFWGKDDTATPLDSAKKINTLINDATLETYDGDHYFFMKNAQDISAKIQTAFLETLGQ
ncbi:alpha/beta fold hydrolase [Sulfurimonas autotrophica]|uniref:Alpha/beta hydrolase fold protein n=1 Tax=Sulfurimonas autotrophica (strain ATCC BAA-671 / DSM 16294 / JCM 11897 / OK10) TaxID=563040 RepID=E0URP8_SULAO|nr:alpha/beta hydrolase [Sulfurimonas autotrophica]ADN08992.1 alpha/beta hydrolase fold protein [Sulfurimonas autotrophica DSM 16294]